MPWSYRQQRLRDMLGADTNLCFQVCVCVATTLKSLSEEEFNTVAKAQGIDLGGEDYAQIPKRNYREELFQPGYVLSTKGQRAEKDNPEIQAITHKGVAADHEIDAVFRELMPQISAFASYNKQYDPQPGIIDESEVETIGIRASLFLYQGGNTRSRIREAKSIANQRVIELQETKRRIRQQLISNRNKLDATKAEILSRSIEVEAAELAQEGVRTEAQLGERTVLDVLDADQELLDAQAALILAERDEVIRHYALAADMGLLLPEKIGVARIDSGSSEHSYIRNNRLSMQTDAD